MSEEEFVRSDDHDPGDEDPGAAYDRKRLIGPLGFVDPLVPGFALYGFPAFVTHSVSEIDTWIADLFDLPGL